MQKKNQSKPFCCQICLTAGLLLLIFTVNMTNHSNNVMFTVISLKQYVKYDCHAALVQLDTHVWIRN